MKQESTTHREKSSASDAPLFVVPVVVLIVVLASPLPPFGAVLRSPFIVVGSQALAIVVFLIGACLGLLLRRTLVFLLSIVGLFLGVWFLPYIDQEIIEANTCRELSTIGTSAQATIINSRVGQPHAIFFLFDGGGGHPTHIVDADIQFPAKDGRVHTVSSSERYPPRLNAPMPDIERSWRKGSIIPIRYLMGDFDEVRSQQYVDLYSPPASSNPLFGMGLPWLLAVPVIFIFVFGKRRPQIPKP